MSDLPTAESMISEAEQMDLPIPARESAFRRCAVNHERAAQRLSGGERTAVEARREAYHRQQAEAFQRAADDCTVDYSQSVDHGGNLPPTPALEQAREAARSGQVEWSEHSGGARRDLRDAHRRAADAHVASLNRSGHLSDAGAEVITQLMEVGDVRSRDIAARWAAATSDPSYFDAFARVVVDPQHGHLNFTPEMQRAWAAVNEVRGWLEGTPGAAGYLVPSVLDPSVILSSAGVASPLRDISRVERITTGDRWQGITSAGTSTEWKNEGAQAQEQVPNVESPVVVTHFLSTFCRFSLEIAADGLRVVEALQTIMADAANTAAEQAYSHGTAVGQPRGVITALIAGQSSVVTPASAESFTKGDPFKLQGELPPRFQANSRWLANITAINEMAQFETGNGALVFPEIRDGRLLRRPLHELSTMDNSSISASATADHYRLLLGDFRHFVIADRIGATFEIVPHLFGANGRPTGERGAWLYFRTGSDVIVENAFRLLNVETNA